ncbi:MAG: T9SS C-terminal target domain-containing protein, partial [Verrucomicrobia bacterium]|nr:T9SS C-terminal target domain-containing protein [Verrucomicrobiota bacterium]
MKFLAVLALMTLYALPLGLIAKADTNASVTAYSPSTRQLAFPTAEGYGRFAVGGRGGRILHVTNLNDSGPGSLREAVETHGPRTVVFDVSGLITLESRLIIRRTNSNLTIAGQTAPGKGICIRKFNMGMLGATNVIIRYVRVRPGNLSGMTLDGMGMASSDNCIIDHCSISWTLDEAISTRGAKNITLQRTLISEALNEAGHKKYPPGTQHGYAASIGGDIGSFHHNLLAHCAGRNWSLAGGLNKPDNKYAGRLDLRNNVIYNWKNRATDGGAHEVNFVANYYKPGPATKYFYALNAQYGGFPGSQRYFFDGNIMVGHFGLTNQTAGRTATTERGGSLPKDYSPWADQPFFDSHIQTHSAHESYTNVLANVGCNFPALDEHDQRVIAEVRRGTYKFKGSKTGLPGLPDSQDDVGGWENYPEDHHSADWDADSDGMSDDWEKHNGLNPQNPADANVDRNGDGFTNLEEYL